MDDDRQAFAREYARIGYREGERWPAPPRPLTTAEQLALLRRVPDGSGLEGYQAVLAADAASGS
jgi:hypothetical protein